MTLADIDLAAGEAEAFAIRDTFASPAEAAAFWAVGADAVETLDLSYAGGAGQPQALRLYRGGGADALTLIYIHGGGWTQGSIDLHDRSARGLAAHGHCNVVSLSYRFAPRHPYPAALEDCLAAADWVAAADLGINAGRVAVGGASAGGNLAAAATLARPGAFDALLIFYGVLGCDLNTGSYLRYENGPGLTRARMAELFEMYDPGDARSADPLITPLLSDRLHNLPPTVIHAAEHDVLLDDNRAFADALAGAGVPVRLHIEPGVTHGFLNRGRLVPSADAAVKRAAADLRRLIEDEGPT